jgi:hypothetical protein
LFIARRWQWQRVFRRSERGREAVVARGYTAPVLEAPEHDSTGCLRRLDVFDGLDANFCPGMRAFNALFLKGALNQSASWPRLPSSHWTLADRPGGCRTAVIDVPSGYKEARGVTVEVAHGVELRAHNVFGAAISRPRSFLPAGLMPCGRLPLGRLRRSLVRSTFDWRQPTLHHLEENAVLTTPRPAAQKRLVRVVVLWRIAPPQPVPIDETMPLSTRQSSTCGLP